MRSLDWKSGVLSLGYRLLSWELTPVNSGSGAAHTSQPVLPTGGKRTMDLSIASDSVLGWLTGQALIGQGEREEGGGRRGEGGGRRGEGGGRREEGGGRREEGGGGEVGQAFMCMILCNRLPYGGREVRSYSVIPNSVISWLLEKGELHLKTRAWLQGTNARS